MHLSDIRYERFNNRNCSAARELLSQDAEAGADLLRVLDEEPELFISAFVKDTLVALVLMEAHTIQSHLEVFVAPRLRRQGIGTAMAKAAEIHLQAGGTRTVSTSFRSGVPASSAFAGKLGYAPYYSLVYMQRTAGLFPVGETPARPYVDGDFLPAHSLYATAFHEMRVRGVSGDALYGI
ncbi:GNAT family N-acetyltransferase [Paenibacillus sp. FSL K6-1217]|uniref:GNAT family N-acetyltransferase n=1 Tax=Paenibacillus sp. FSL K6-1217 TaxID=2921466 RepID=UPI003250DB6A